MLLQYGIISFLLMISNIPICVCITFSLSVDGHLGGVHVLTIVNSAAMNIEVQLSF